MARAPTRAHCGLSPGRHCAACTDDSRTTRHVRSTPPRGPDTLVPQLRSAIRGVRNRPRFRLNQDLGSHGIHALLAMEDEVLLRAELHALRDLEAGGASIALSLPFVRRAGEVSKVRAIAERECGSSFVARLRLGVFVETPAMALSTERLLEQAVDHVFVGTKDLTTVDAGLRPNRPVACERIRHLPTIASCNSQDTWC